MSATRSFAGWEALSKGRVVLSFGFLGFGSLSAFACFGVNDGKSPTRAQSACFLRKTQNSKLTSPFPGALYIRASCLADFSGHVAFRFCMLRLKPWEVANEIVKYQDLSVAFGTGTYADCGYRDSASD